MKKNGPRSARGTHAMTLFVTGTDTGVGKTHVSAGLLAAARELGIAACGYKPVASGCRRGPRGLRNADALALIRASGTEEPYDRINPYAFAPAIAPHLAAREAGQRIERRVLDARYRELARTHDLVIVEGAGGWQIPFGRDWTQADWVARHGWPVLLVVGMRLGCMNHALLSAESIRPRTRLLGWVANELPPRQPRLDDNIAELQMRMPAPLLGRVGSRAGSLCAQLCAVLERMQVREGR
ncbi:dethiobiotin synthase [Panacagrimonas perspica]|uniref:ATP-dependent dethiobiotin synthetase BioD n=2 Tax=Panacagrimonas perspica TaxID=381431 RepID=A0A4R7NWZ2_9GAMM|nr:dethiobiotin synthase [Panacagrimonas perspica]TDU25744.1 dethiobiotin synthase [Panacagrimonas perspica]